MKEFWIVCRMDGAKNNLTHGFRHVSLDYAKAEAAKLAAQYAAEFCVLHCVGFARPTSPPIVWVDAEGRDSADASDAFLAANPDPMETLS